MEDSFRHPLKQPRTARLSISYESEDILFQSEESKAEKSINFSYNSVTSNSPIKELHHLPPKSRVSDFEWSTDKLGKHEYITETKFCKLVQGSNRKSKEPALIKVITKAGRLQAAMFELSAYFAVSSDNFINSFIWNEDKSNIYIVFDSTEGKLLSSIMKGKEFLTEMKAAEVFIQIVNAVQAFKIKEMEFEALTLDSFLIYSSDAVILWDLSSVRKVNKNKSTNSVLAILLSELVLGEQTKNWTSCKSCLIKLRRSRNLWLILEGAKIKRTVHS